MEKRRKQTHTTGMKLQKHAHTIKDRNKPPSLLNKRSTAKMFFRKQTNQRKPQQ